MILHKISRFVLGAALCLAVAATAMAQYNGGNPGMGVGGGTAGGTNGGIYTPPKGGYKSSTGIAIGAAAAAGIGVAYLVMRNRKSVEGCLTETAGGATLVDAKTNKTYMVDTGDLSLKAGERVKLRGRKEKTTAGAPEFAAKKLVKDYGSCSSHAALGQSPAS